MGANILVPVHQDHTDPAIQQCPRDAKTGNAAPYDRDFGHFH